MVGVKLRIVGVELRTAGVAIVEGVFSSCIEVTDLMADSCNYWENNTCNNNVVWYVHPHNDQLYCSVHNHHKLEPTLFGWILAGYKLLLFMQVTLAQSHS